MGRDVRSMAHASSVARDAGPVHVPNAVAWRAALDIHTRIA